MNRKVAPKDIAAALKPLSFQMQSDQSFVYFVRPNATTVGLFERLECVYVGRPPDTIVLSVSLSVVQHVALQFRGLIKRDGWPEVCTDAENGRVAFQNSGEITEWLAQLADRVPERFERLVREKSDTLLAETREARERVAKAAETIVSGCALADALREPFAGLTEEETKLAKTLMQLPYVVPSEELWSVSGVAIAALIRSGDHTIAQTVNAPTPIDRIAQLNAVPDDLNRRIRLLVDRILIWRDDLESW
jgi:hypothetical protein